MAHYYIDGLNICKYQHDQHRIVSLGYLIILLEELLKRKHTFFIFFDTSTNKELSKNNEGEIYRELKVQYPGILMEVPSGTEADEFLLLRANTEDAKIITNDRYRDYQDDYPWVINNNWRLIKGLIGERRLQIPELSMDIPLVANVLELIDKLRPELSALSRQQHHSSFMSENKKTFKSDKNPSKSNTKMRSDQNINTRKAGTINLAKIEEYKKRITEAGLKKNPLE